MNIKLKIIIAIAVAVLVGAGIGIGYWMRGYISPTSIESLVQNKLHNSSSLLVLYDEPERSPFSIQFYALDVDPVGHAEVHLQDFSSSSSHSELSNLAFGFGPDELDKTAALQKKAVPGRIQQRRPEPNELVQNDLIILRTTKDKYDRVCKLIERWATYPDDYILGERDCVRFLMDVARESGLVVPPRSIASETPAVYLNRLFEANTSCAVNLIRGKKS